MPLFSHLFFFSGKTKSIVKNDQLLKKKYPDYKVAYVVLVGNMLYKEMHREVTDCCEGDA